MKQALRVLPQQDMNEGLHEDTLHNHPCNAVHVLKEDSGGVIGFLIDRIPPRNVSSVSSSLGSSSLDCRCLFRILLLTRCWPPHQR
jgi:hypothetical protein